MIGSEKHNVVALIPARSGSRRIAHKNVKKLGAHPMMAYTIAAAKASGIFTSVVVSTDDERYAKIACHYGAEALDRPPEIAGEHSPDIEWIVHALKTLSDRGRKFDCFSILRPTSPFRQAETIRRAWSTFAAQTGIDSLRAVEKCRQHPGKMWVIRGDRMLPLLPLSSAERPWHSLQYVSLPEVFVQNASLEIAWTRVPLENGTIAGTVIVPFLTKDLEGVDVNDPRDWDWAERLVAERPGALPHIELAPYSG